MRLFVGIPLAEGVVRQLSGVCARLRRKGDGLRWPAAESWHITLQFLGNTTEERFECLQARLAEVRSAPVPVRLGAPGVFERAGVFVVAVDLTPELVALQQRVVEVTQKCGFVPEERPYHPHITLARAKGDGRRLLKELKARTVELPALPPFVAHEFLLYESHLGPGGSRYVVKGRFGLAV